MKSEYFSQGRIRMGGSITLDLQKNVKRNETNKVMDMTFINFLCHYVKRSKTCSQGQHQKTLRLRHFEWTI